MARPVVRLSDLEPLGALRVRPRSAYRGTITTPGRLASDGKVILRTDRLPAAHRDLAEQVVRPPDEAEPPVPQAEARRVFAAVVEDASKRAQVLGQWPKPAWLAAAEVERVAVLRYGRGGSTRYVFTDAHRLVLLQTLTGADEWLCAGPQAPVLLRRRGRPVAVLTALRIEPAVER